MRQSTWRSKTHTTTATGASNFHNTHAAEHPGPQGVGAREREVHTQLRVERVAAAAAAVAAHHGETSSTEAATIKIFWDKLRGFCSKPARTWTMFSES